MTTDNVLGFELVRTREYSLMNWGKYPVLIQRDDHGYRYLFADPLVSDPEHVTVHSTDFAGNPTCSCCHERTNHERR